MSIKTVMTSGVEFLYKILKDETRRKIVLLINEKQALSHTELINQLGFLTTGRLNYHLKQLNDLLTKDAEGRYTLTEKGKLATRLLIEFPDQNRHQMGLKPKWWKKFWIAIGTSAILLTSINLIVYVLGYVSLTLLLQSFLVFFALIGTLYMVEHITVEVLSEKNRSRLLHISNFSRGIVVGFLLWLALSFIVVYSGFSQLIYDVLGRELEICITLSSLVLCLVIGTFVGKWLASRFYQTF
ncbi:MAG: winged helix-turn-helix domain-containing protein [Candidatus Bathyarchaeota archaeon]|nr:winged helix-turn-helix domain-containing protein [Candidatus Bathyarchaeota archaeon]